MDALLLSNDNDDKDTPRTLIPDRNKSTNIEIGGFFDPSYMKKAQGLILNLTSFFSIGRFLI